ncbi:MAG: HYR domain-containing protein, partial [Blastocatellia bacterium]
MLLIVAGILIVKPLREKLMLARTSASTTVSEPSSPASWSDQVSVHAAGRGRPYINFGDGHDVLTSYETSATSEVSGSSPAKPLAMASADFDEDGVPDLVSGYSASGAGMLNLHRGNVDSIYPNAPEAQQRKASGLFTNAPFLSPARVFDLSAAADFVGAGDFDADGHWDAVTANRGNNALYFSAGDGKGNFRPAERIELSGRVTAMATGEVNRADGLTDLVVGVATASGARALVFESPEGALRGKAESFTLRDEATAIAIGNLDAEYTMDIAIAAGRELMVINGRDRKLSLDEKQQATVPKARTSQRAFSFGLKSVAIGDFKGDHNVGLAVLTDQGSVHLLSADSAKAKKKGIKKWKDEVWASGSWAQATQIVRARVSSVPSDDLVIVDGPGHKLHIVAKAAPSQEQQAQSLQSVSFDVEDEPMAVIPMRLNSDALSDLVILRNGQVGPTAVTSEPLLIFSVTTNQDNVAGSLRAAIDQANTNAGLDTINFQIGTGPQTITPTSPLPQITDAVTIDGTTQPGFAGNPIIELNGSSAGSSANGLFITGGNSVVRGLVINRFNGGSLGFRDGIELETNGSNVIEGNYIGTDLSGAANLGNNGIGVCISGAANNAIGGTAVGARNVISANGDGIVIEGIGATGNLVQGNFIGTDVSGTADLGNAQFGVGIFAANNTIGGTAAGARNVISGSEIEGFVIVNSSSGSSATGNLVQGNFIGTDVSGTAALGNFGEAVAIGAANNTIGGTAAGARNVISGNNGQGIAILGGDATGNQVQGNYIGTDINGTAALSNTADGVDIINAANNTIGGTAAGARNVISGNNLNGIVVTNPGASGNQILGNYIGVDATGTAVLGNGDPDSFVNGLGIFVNNAPNNVIGGPTVAARNLISGNVRHGVSFQGVNAISNELRGNFIGTDPTGTSSVGNGGHGVVISGGSNSNVTGNLISGNGAGLGFGGLVVTAAPSIGPGTGNVIHGNLIGTNAAGTGALGNHSFGVALAAPNNAVTNNLISGNGTEPGFGAVHVAPTSGGATGSNSIIQNNLIGLQRDGISPLGNNSQGVSIGGFPGFVFKDVDVSSNTIAFNSGDGVLIASGTGHRVSSNSMFSNGNLGINLTEFTVENGVTPNDPGDSDTGTNNVQNFPVLTSVTRSAQETTIHGTLNSTPNALFTIQFFASIECDPSGFGEGEAFLGSRQVATDNNGNVNFTFLAAPDVNQFITATATDASGNTSEFSQCAQAGEATADLQITKTASPNPVKVGATLTYTIAVTNKGPNAADSVRVTDALHDSLTFLSCASSAGGFCAGSGNDRRVSFTSLAPGATATITFVATLKPSVVNGTVISNTALVSSTTADPVAANNTAAITTLVSDVALGITCPSGPPVTAAQSQTSAVVTYPNPTVNDSRTGVTIICVPPSGSAFPLGSTMVDCTATDQAGGRATCSFSVTVNPATPPMPVPDKTAVDFGPPVVLPNQNPPSDTFTLTNPSVVSANVTFASISRTGSDVTSGRITDPDDTGLFTVFADGSSTPIAPGSILTIAAGQTRNFRIMFNPTVPAVAQGTSNLAANQVLPDVVKSDLLFTQSGGGSVTIGLTGRVSTALRLIHPANPTNAPVVTFSRSGNQFNLIYSVFDSNLNVSRASYQFLDGGGQPSGQPVEVNLAQALQAINLVRGQSF